MKSLLLILLFFIPETRFFKLFSSRVPNTVHWVISIKCKDFSGFWHVFNVLQSYQLQTKLYLQISFGIVPKVLSTENWSFFSTFKKLFLKKKMLTNTQLIRGNRNLNVKWCKKLTFSKILIEKKKQTTPERDSLIVFYCVIPSAICLEMSSQIVSSKLYVSRYKF